MSAKSTTNGFVFTQKYLTYGFILFASISFIVMFYSEPELDQVEQLIVRRLGELHMREEHVKMDFQELKIDTWTLVDHLNQAVSALKLNRSIDIGVQKNFKDFAGSLSSFRVNENLRIPSIHHFLPHLLLNFSSLQPAYKWSKNRRGVSNVLGVPTVKRPAQSYLLPTLNDLIYKMRPEDRNDTLIVVFIAEVDEDYVQQIVSDIKSLFQMEMNSGLIDIISPPASFYPNFEKISITLSDPVERVRWRSKQSLDFAFLMMYAYTRGMFYIQLEDDILARRNYLTTMKDIALTKIANKQPWFVLDFCQLGFIGKMFRCVDLPWIIQFFFMFFNDKPVDWLLDAFIQTKVCNLEKDQQDCRTQKDRMWVHIKPSLFQHIGTTSSLKGKIQKLKDKQFGRIALFRSHRNPPASVYSSIQAYKKHTLNRAYRGETFFWGYAPRSGDWISFQFDRPIRLKSFKFITGNVESPSDILHNTSVLVALHKDVSLTSSSVIMLSVDGSSSVSPYLIVGTFNNLGFAEGKIDRSVGLVTEMRLLVHHDSANWVILSELEIVQDSKR